MGRKSDNDPDKCVMARHTRAKHQILEKYLAAWYSILSRWNGRIVYIDGFAGRGRYDDGSEGSPQIAMRTLLDHGHLDRMKRCEFRFLFIEKDQENAAAVVAELDRFRASYPNWPDNVIIEVVNASFDDQMRNVIAMVEEQNTHLAPGVFPVIETGRF